MERRKKKRKEKEDEEYTLSSFFAWLFETRGQNVPDRKLTVLAIEGKTRSTVMLYREG